MFTPNGRNIQSKQPQRVLACITWGEAAVTLAMSQGNCSIRVQLQEFQSATCNSKQGNLKHSSI